MCLPSSLPHFSPYTIIHTRIISISIEPRITLRRHNISDIFIPRRESNMFCSKLLQKLWFFFKLNFDCPPRNVSRVSRKYLYTNIYVIIFWLSLFGFIFKSLGAKPYAEIAWPIMNSWQLKVYGVIKIVILCYGISVIQTLDIPTQAKTMLRQFESE